MISDNNVAVLVVISIFDRCNRPGDGVDGAQYKLNTGQYR